MPALSPISSIYTVTGRVEQYEKLRRTAIAISREMFARVGDRRLRMTQNTDQPSSRVLLTYPALRISMLNKKPLHQEPCFEHNSPASAAIASSTTEGGQRAGLVRRLSFISRRPDGAD